MAKKEAGLTIEQILAKMNDPTAYETLSALWAASALLRDGKPEALEAFLLGLRDDSKPVSQGNCLFDLLDMASEKSTALVLKKAISASGKGEELNATLRELAKEDSPRAPFALKLYMLIQAGE